MRRLAAIIFGIVFTASAYGAESTAVRDGDRVHVTLPNYGAAWLFLDALEGTRLTLVARAASPGPVPEIAVLDEKERELARAFDEGRAKIKGFVVPATGRLRIVVRTENNRAGVIDLKIRARPPKRLRAKGRLAAPGETAEVRVPMFVGSLLRLRAKGKVGLRLDEPTVVTPTEEEVAVRDGGFASLQFGDHRLRIAGADGTVGRFRAKLRLTHPATPARNLTVQGIDESPEPADFPTPTDPPEDPGPPDYGPWPLVSNAATSTFRETLEFVDSAPDPEFPSVRYATDTLRIRVRLENTSSAPQAITFWDSPIPCIGFRNLDDGRYYGTCYVVGWTNTVTYVPGPALDRTFDFPPDYFDYRGFPAGRYEVTAGFATTDTRIPQSAAIYFYLKR